MAFRSTRNRLGLIAAGLAVPATVAITAAAGLPAQAATVHGWRISKRIPVANTVLSDVAAASTKDAWAVGTGLAGSGTPVLYHWRGSSWRKVTRPGPAGSFAADVATSSAGNTWVSIANSGSVDHWNGHSWSRKTFGTNVTALPDGVVTTGQRNVWVFTYNFTTKTQAAHHFNGRKWTTATLPATINGGGLTGLVSASSATNIWAWAENAAATTWETLHFNGKSWKVVSIPAALAPASKTTIPKEMLAESATNVWGTFSDFSGSTTGPVNLLHWNGHRWSRITKNLPTGLLTGPIAADGHGGLWLGAETTAGKPVLLHYHGSTWTRVKVPTDPLGAVVPGALAQVPGTRSVWGVSIVGPGGFGTMGADILRYTP